MAETDRELDLALHNVAALLDLASSLAIGSMTRGEDRFSGVETYSLRVSEGDQLAALLLAARDYATRALTTHEKEAE